LDGQLALQWRGHALAVALHDVIDIDVPPAAGVVINNLDDRVLADEVGDVPRMPVEPFAAAGPIVGPGGRAHALAGDEQVDARLVRVHAAADKEINVFALDL